MARKKKDNRKLVIIFSFSMLVILLMGLIFIKASYIEGTNDGFSDGMNNAEFNCAKLLCEKNNCSNIQIISEAQKYCKSLVYGTDFYMEN